MLVQDFSYKIKKAALECANVLVSRNFHINNDERNKLLFIPLFETGGLNDIFKFWMSLYEVSNVSIEQLQQIQNSKNLPEDNYKLLLSIAEVLFILLI